MRRLIAGDPAAIASKEQANEMLTKSQQQFESQLNELLEGGYTVVGHYTVSSNTGESEVFVLFRR